MSELGQGPPARDTRRRVDAAVAIGLAVGAAAVTGLGLVGVPTRSLVLGLLAAYLLTALLSDRLALYGFMSLLGAQFYFPIVSGITVAFTEILAAIFIGSVLSRQLVGGRVTLPATPLSVLVLLYGMGNVLYLLNSALEGDAIRMFGRGALLAGSFWAVRAVWVREGLFRPALMLLVPLAVFSMAVQFGLVAVFGGLEGLPLYILYIQIPSAAGVFPPIQGDLIPTMLLYPEARPGSYLDPFGGGYGLYLLAILPLFLLLAVQPRLRRRLLGWLLGTACALALAFTQSRTGVYAAIGGVLVLGIMARKEVQIAALLAVFTLVIGIAANDYLGARLLSRTDSAISSAEGRFRDYVPRSISNGLQNPILGGGRRVFDKSRGGVLPHNQFLSDFQGRGLSGLLLGVLMFGIAGIQALVLRRRALSADERFAATWAAAVVGSYFLACFATTPADYLQLIAPLLLALALLDVIGLRHSPAPHVAVHRADLAVRPGRQEPLPQG